MGSSTSTSELTEVMEMCKAGHGSSNEPFVRLVQAAPEPMCILATDRQLDEMVCNCTDTQFTCLGVDPTFKLGAFYATPIVFPLRMLVTKLNGKSPVYLGPMLVHQTQKFSAYRFFASQIVSLRPELTSIKAVGTDGEAALFDAFVNVFPKDIHLRCFSHFKRNIQEKLRTLHFPDKTSKEIIKDTFGTRTEKEWHMGLVDCCDEDTFRTKLENLKHRWDEMEKQYCLSQKGIEIEPAFHKWFTDEKSHDVARCMLKNVRIKAGMGQEPDHFYTNMSESMNKTLKERTDYKAQSLRQFIDKMFTFHKAQENLLRKAVLRNDRWRFREEYEHLEIDSDKWFTMSAKMQKAHMKKILSEPLLPVIIPTQSSASTSEEPCTEMEVSYKSILNSYRISNETLKEILEKAYQLVHNSDLISKVPGQINSNNRMVASLSENPPHYIQEKSKGQFVCSGVCHRFITYKICEHIVASCQDSGNLSKFCNWWKCQKSGPNLDALALSG